MRSAGRAVGLAVVVLVFAGAASAALAASPRITLYFGLTRPEAQARSAFFAVGQPGSATYRRFLSPAQVAVRYGASPAVRSAFIRAATGDGFSVSIDASGVFARVTGSVARFERVFRVHLTHSVGSGPPVSAYGTSRALRLPPDLRPRVNDVVSSFLNQQTVPSASVSGRPRATVAGAKGPKRTGTWMDGCRQAKETGAFSYAQVRHAYGIDRLGNSAGASVAILGLTEKPSADDVADNAKCFGYRKLRSRTLLTDGQTYPIDPGTFEPQEDLALVRGMAPAASLTFTQAWSDADQWFLGASQVLDSSPLPDSFSISYGICESEVVGRQPGATPSTRAGADLLNSLLVRLGLAGVGTYASAGDGGSSCNGALSLRGTGPNPPPLRGVAWPGSSPYLTSVGGTRLTLTSANQRHDEVVWNDLRWLHPSDGGGAGGGGLSLFSPRPPFQSALGLPGDTRAVPDVSAAASNFPGWPVVLGGSWGLDGGTSAAAPLVAAAMAVISANLRRHDLPPIGPADGLFYYLARSQRSTLWDVIHGNNGFYPSIPARYAKRGYDLASGLGVPRFAQITQRLPAPGPTQQPGTGLG